jgi:hypothetical protein
MHLHRAHVSPRCVDVPLGCTPLHQNPFDAREAKVYQNEGDIASIGALRSAYEKCDVDAFGKALDEINNQGDKFISQRERCAACAVRTERACAGKGSSLCMHC